MTDMQFKFDVPVVFFEKASAPGRERRIAGIISSETRDRQGEVILQRGLDFSNFLTYGWFNDNHSRKLEDVVGYPDAVTKFSKGDKLPDGSTAQANLSWAEGYLLDTQKGNAFWELGNALKKTDRRIGYSIEGSVEKRIGPDRKTIAKANVKHVAITHVPVNADARLEVLAKSLAAIESENDDGNDMSVEPDDTDVEKMLTSGATSASMPRGTPITGAGAGQLLSPLSLEGVTSPAAPASKRRIKKSEQLSVGEALTYVMAQYGCSIQKAKQIVDFTARLARLGRL